MTDNLSKCWINHDTNCQVQLESRILFLEMWTGGLYCAAMWELAGKLNTIKKLHDRNLLLMGSLNKNNQNTGGTRSHENPGYTDA